MGVLPFNELYHRCFVIISTVQLKIFSMLMLKSAMIRIFKRFGLLVVLSYPYFHCQQIKKMKNGSMTCCHSRLSTCSTSLTSLLIWLRLTRCCHLKHTLIHLRREVLILHVCSSRNIFKHHNTLQLKGKQTWHTVLFVLILYMRLWFQQVFGLSVVSNVTLHS